MNKNLIFDHNRACIVLAKIGTLHSKLWTVNNWLSLVLASSGETPRGTILAVSYAFGRVINSCFFSIFFLSCDACCVLQAYSLLQKGRIPKGIVGLSLFTLFLLKCNSTKYFFRILLLNNNLTINSLIKVPNKSFNFTLIL